jgi:hypothetical protein
MDEAEPELEKTAILRTQLSHSVGLASRAFAFFSKRHNRRPLTRYLIAFSDIESMCQTNHHYTTVSQACEKQS